MMEMFAGIALIVGVAKLGEFFVELAKSRRGASATADALILEIRALRHELAQSRQFVRTNVATPTSVERPQTLASGESWYQTPVAPRPTTQSTAPGEVAQRLARLQSEIELSRATSGTHDATFDEAVARLERRLQEMDREQATDPATVRVTR